MSPHFERGGSLADQTLRVKEVAGIDARILSSASKRLAIPDRDHLAATSSASLAPVLSTVPAMVLPPMA